MWLESSLLLSGNILYKELDNKIVTRGKGCQILHWLCTLKRFETTQEWVNYGLVQSFLTQKLKAILIRDLGDEKTPRWDLQNKIIWGFCQPETGISGKSIFPNP